MNEDRIYEDRSLFSRVAEGDEAAFRLLFEQYTSYLLPYAARFLNSETVAEEIVQEVFIRVWMHRDQLPAIENPKAWIFRIASNLCYVHLRRNEVERRVHKQLKEKEDTTTVIAPGYKELQEAIEEAVQLMPEKRKKIYQLSRVDGLKPSEIAEQLDLSVSTVKNTLGTALEFIREHLVKKGLFVWACSIFLKNL